jgi:Fic family protein
VHPFLNGNGRWSRLLANIWLALHDQPVIFWPETSIGSVSVARDEYLTAIRAADEGSYGHLMEMQSRYARRLED